MLSHDVLVFISIFVHLGTALAPGCDISFPIQDDRNEPVLLKTGRDGKYELLIPGSNPYILQNGEEIELFCSSGRNVLKETNRNFTEATCVRDDTLRLLNQNYKFTDIQCKTVVKADTLNTNTQCGNNQGRVIKIGFHIENDWITLIESCYDSNQANALYAEHTLYGQFIKFASKQSYRPNFQNEGVTKGINANDAYKQTNQKRVFTQLLGSEGLADKYVSKNSFLDRGHLAPDADFLFAGLQFSTYFYINACPQWDSVNGGNWLGIENLVRKFAGNHQRPLRIITGSHGVLTLPDANNKPQEIYLSKGSLPVPKFLWKIVYSESSKQGIAFVALNDPFITKITGENLLCNDICGKYGWQSPKWNNMKKGFVYCCDVRDLQRTVRTIPKLAIRDVLKGTK